MPNKDDQHPARPAVGVGLLGRRPATWDEKVKRVTTNLAGAAIQVILPAGITIAIVLLLIKLGTWALS